MRRIMAVAVLGLMVLGACGDDGGDTGPGAGAPAGDEEAGEEGSSDAGASGTAMGTATIDGTVHEFPDVRDCGLGNAGFANDRDFVGYSADGTAAMTVGYFEDESLAGLNAFAVEIDNPHALYSSTYSPDGEFQIEVRPDGADGSTTVGVVGVDVPEGEFAATWSFTC